MPVPSTIGDLSTTAASNSPAGGDNISTADDYLRALSAFIAQLSASKAPFTAAALVGGTVDGNDLGYRKIVRVSSTGKTLDATDVGKCIATTGELVVNNSVFSAGDAISIYNNSASAVSVSAGAGVTLRLAGTTTTGARAIAARGLATMWFNSASEAVISGAGVS